MKKLGNIEDLEKAEVALHALQELSELSDLVPIDALSIDQARERLESSIEQFHKGNKEIVDLIKTDNVIKVNDSDGVAVSVTVYLKVLNDEPDWRGYIKLETISLGEGDEPNERWISYQPTFVIGLSELIEKLATHKYAVGDELKKEMEDKIEEFKSFSENFFKNKQIL